MQHTETGLWKLWEPLGFSERQKAGWLGVEAVRLACCFKWHDFGRVRAVSKYHTTVVLACRLLLWILWFRIASRSATVWLIMQLQSMMNSVDNDHAWAQVAQVAKPCLRQNCAPTPHLAKLHLVIDYFSRMDGQSFAAGWFWIQLTQGSSPDLWDDVLAARAIYNLVAKQKVLFLRGDVICNKT